jgi:hypothetical protein
MAENAKPPKGEKRYWLDESRNITKIFWGLVIFCLSLVVADVFYERHGYFAIEDFPGIYGLYGLISALSIVFLGIGLRRLVMRDEDYYDR